jgi:hypothetical protein
VHASSLVHNLKPFLYGFEIRQDIQILINTACGSPQKVEILIADVIDWVKY